jgi:hypothetical protein
MKKKCKHYIALEKYLIKNLYQVILTFFTAVVIFLIFMYTTCNREKIVPFDEFYYQLKLMYLFQKHPV